MEHPIMWQRTFSKVYQGVSKENIWKLWTDIQNWPKWHDDLEYCNMNGPFKVGNYFMLKPKGMKAVKITLTEINHGTFFTDCTKFLGAKMYDTHMVEQTPDGVKLTNKLVVKGPLKWLWVKLVAQHVANTVPDETNALIALARGMND